jgi:hypothetical protein
VVGRVVRSNLSLLLILLISASPAVNSCEVTFAGSDTAGTDRKCSEKEVTAGKSAMKSDEGVYHCIGDDCNEGDKTKLEALIVAPPVTTTLAPGEVSSQISAYSYSFVSWSVCHHGIVLIVELILIYRRRSSSVT